MTNQFEPYKKKARMNSSAPEGLSVPAPRDTCCVTLVTDSMKNYESGLDGICD